MIPKNIYWKFRKLFS